eukprot:719974_1
MEGQSDGAGSEGLGNSQNKMSDILDFLNNAGSNSSDAGSECRLSVSQTRLPVTNTFGYDKGTPNDTIREEENPDILASQILGDIQSRMAEMRVQVRDKSQTIEILEKTIQNLKAEGIQMRKRLIKQSKDKIMSQKKEYEQTIQRHLSFIDRLLADKEMLNAKCEALTDKMTESETQFSAKLDDISAQHKRNIQKHKEAWEAGEKARRDMWMKEKTKSIKESTIRSLEPQLQRLIEKNQNTADSKEREKMESLQDQERKLRLEMQREIRKISELMLKDHETSVQKERDDANIRLKAQIDRFESQLADQRKDLSKEFDEQRRILESEFRDRERTLEDSVRKASTREVTRVTELERKHAAELEDITRKERVALKQAREQWKIERDQWQQQRNNDLQNELKVKERETRERVAEQSRREIDMIISKFTEENQTNKDSLIEEYERMINKDKDEHAEEIRTIRQKESEWMQKYMELSEPHLRAKERVSALEGDFTDLKSRYREKEEEVLKIHGRKPNEQRFANRGI